MTHFFNEKLRAWNVLEINVNPKDLEKFQDLCENGLASENYSTDRPNWASDIVWIGAKNTESYNLFYDSFEKMRVDSEVIKYLDLDKRAAFGEVF